MNILCLFSILITASSGWPESSYPPLYAIDINGLNGHQIFRRVISKHCLIYENIEQNNLNLVLDFGEWRIIETISYSSSDDFCYITGGKSLFTQQGEIPSSEGWTNTQTNISNVMLSVYALEECTIYTGAYVDADFYYNSILSNGDINSCHENFIKYSDTFLFTTETKDDGESQIYCRFYYLNFLKRGKMTLSSDEKAKILIANPSCDIALNILNISEALSHNSTYLTSLVTNEEGLPWIFIGTGVGTLFTVLLLVVILGYRLGCCEKKKSKADSDNYGRTSIDNNLQYGEEKEYYQYHNDKKQTRVVDDNEIYGYYEYDK